MTEFDFEKFIHKQIPITKVMGFWVKEFKSDKVCVGAKLGPNINHKSTAFGGSINSLMTICGWAITYNNIKEIDSKAHIVIQSSQIKYKKPVERDFIAQCKIEDSSKIEKFIKIFSKHGIASLEVEVFIYEGEEVLVEYKGRYAALKDNDKRDNI